MGDAIKAARAQLKNDKGTTMTQSDLAKKIYQPAGVVNDYERGTAKPDQNILRDMERVLKVHLRGDKIGQPKVLGKKT